MIRRSLAVPPLSLALLLAWLLGAGAPPASAEWASARAGAGGPVMPPPALNGTLELSVTDAVVLGLENNLDVRVNRFDPLVAYEESIIAWGPYDPRIIGNLTRDHIETPSTNPLIGADVVRTDVLGGTADVVTLVPLLNAELGVGFSGFESETNSSLQSLSPQYTSDVTFFTTIPVLRNLVWSPEWTALQISRIGYGIAHETFRAQVMDVVTNIELDYWDLIAAAQQVEVQEATIETNRAQLDQVRTQYEVGVVSKVEVVEAQAGVAQAEFNLILARNRYRNAQDQLILRILGVRLEPKSRLVVKPTDDPAEVLVRDVDVEAAVRKAFANRPELVIADQQVREQEVVLKFARNQRLPRLDFVGSYGYNGLSGRTNPDRLIFGTSPPPRVPGPSFDDSFTDYFQDDGARSWSAGGVFTIPIGNVAGRHDVTQSKLELRRAVTSVERLRHSIILDVRTEARNLLASIQGIEAAERNVDFTAEQLRAEQVRLEHGESTPFQVLQRQEDYVRAQSQLIAALQQYQRAVTLLNRAQGTTLSARDIRIDDVAELR